MPTLSNQPRSLFTVSSVSKPALAYAVLSGGPAGVTPFAALWLKAHSTPTAALGLLLALPLMARIILAGPLALWASRFSKPWKPVSLLCGIAAFASLLALSGYGTWSCILAWWIICFSVGACVPLMDTATLGSGAAGGESLLAKAKSAGAIAYMGANIAVGFVFARFGAEGVVIWAGLTSLIASAVIPPLMPMTPAPHCARYGARTPCPDKEPAKTDATLLMVLMAAALIEASHGFNAMAMISWAERGYGPSVSGMLWAAGIVADVFFLMFMGSLRVRIGPSRMLVLAGVAAFVRWAGFATIPALPMMFVLQALHALSFTAAYLASVELVHKLSDDKRRLRAQASNWAFSTGLGMGLSVLCAGPLYAILGAQGYWVMSGVAAIGLVLAISAQRRAASFASYRRVDYNYIRPNSSLTDSKHVLCAETMRMNHERPSSLPSALQNGSKARS